MTFKITCFRFLIASRDIEAGETILKDLPLSVGPCLGAGLQCVTCGFKVLFCLMTLYTFLCYLAMFTEDIESLPGILKIFITVP